jgi:MFS family permease
VFPAFKSNYAFLNAIALICCGISSSLLGGIISDKYEKKSYMTKANIIMAGNVLSIPLVALAVWTQSFYVAMAAFAMKIFVSGSYYAPAITMMQNSTRPSNSGLVVSVYTFFAYIAQTISPLVFQRMAKSMNAAANPRVYGIMVLTATTIGYLGSNFFYRRAGKEYTKVMEEKDKMAESCELDPELMEADVVSIKPQTT